MSKQYGLILPGQKAANPKPKTNIPKPSIFGSDSDSDGCGPPQLKKQGAPIGPGASEKRLAKRMQQKALEEDPTVYQYDELYDEMESKRAEEKQAKKSEVKEAKYINRLLEYADKRKLENERRVERMVQKEREEEGEQFKDKESFVTSAYRKKLEELRQAEEQEKREDYLEAIGDVTKQQDLGGFYRHIYAQKLGSSSVPDEKKKEELAYAPISSKQRPQEEVKKVSKSRAYRKHHSSEDEAETIAKEENPSPAKKAHIQSNLDADSDFSIDSSDSEEEKEKPASSAPEVAVKSEPKESSPKPENKFKEPEAIKPIDEEMRVKEEEAEVEKPMKAKKNKDEIWKKRTVGDVFDAALQRYYERKSAVGSG